MYKRFCINCGKETDILINGLCWDCYIKLKRKIEKDINIKICPYCKRIKYKNKWMEYESFLEILEKHFGKIIKKEKDLIVTEDFILKIKYKREICPICMEYLNERSYNYVIQVRGDKEKIKEIINLFSKLIVKKIEEKKKGIDIYLKASQKEINKILSKINYKIMKISRKIIGYDRQKSKKKYRVYISLRI